MIITVYFFNFANIQIKYQQNQQVPFELLQPGCIRKVVLFVLSFNLLNRVLGKLTGDESMMSCIAFSSFFNNVTAIDFHIIKNKMSFNISQNIIVQSETEKISKFPKSGSKVSLTTEDDFYFQTEIAPRKISNEQKERFISIITNQNINMKEASKIVGMSYSSAKKVFSRFRKALKIRNSNKIAKVVYGVVCDYIQVPTNQSCNVSMVSVISTIGGREQIRQQREQVDDFLQSSQIAQRRETETERNA